MTPWIMPATVLAAGLVSAALLLLPRNWRIVGAICTLVILAISPMWTLGKPKPVTPGVDGIVLETYVLGRESILIWLIPDGGDEPRSLMIPWSKELEEQMRKALGESEEEGNRTKFRFEPSLETEKKFYSMPQPAPPPKMGEEQEQPEQEGI